MNLVDKYLGYKLKNNNKRQQQNCGESLISQSTLSKTTKDLSITSLDK